MRKFLFAAATLLCACGSGAQPAPAPAPVATGAPKLLVVISVDQFSADLWDEYGPHFIGGLARLGREIVLAELDFVFGALPHEV